MKDRLFEGKLSKKKNLQNIFVPPVPMGLVITGLLDLILLHHHPHCALNKQDLSHSDNIGISLHKLENAGLSPGNTRALMKIKDSVTDQLHGCNVYKRLQMWCIIMWS